MKAMSWKRAVCTKCVNTIKMAVFAEKKEAETLQGNFYPAVKQGGQGRTLVHISVGHISESQEKIINPPLFPTRLWVITERDSPKLHRRALPGWESFCQDVLQEWSSWGSLAHETWPMGFVAYRGQEGQGREHLLSLFPFLPLIAWCHPTLSLPFSFPVN